MVILILAAVAAGCDGDAGRRTSTLWRTPPAARAVADAAADASPPLVASAPLDPFARPDPADTTVASADASEPDAPEPDVAGVAPDDAPEPEDPLAPEDLLRVVVISDLNGSYGSTTYGADVHRAIDRIVALAPDLVISTGDMVAGQRAGLDYHAMWDAFHRAVSDPLAEAHIPFAVTPGNHDASGYPGFGTERAIFVDAWRARTPPLELVAADDYPLRYAFRLGPALFVSLDATTVGPLAAPQRAWLDATLAAHPADVRVVFGHMPLWPVAEGREDDFIGDLALEAIMERHHVDLYLAGHHHAYFPGRRGALRQVSLACLGSGPRRLLGQAGASPKSFVILEIDKLGVASIEALRGTAFDTPIERATLPTSVGAAPWRVWRDDADAAP